MNKNQMTEFSFEKETNLFVPRLMLNTSAILMSSLSSLINAIFIIVCHVDVFL